MGIDTNFYIGIYAKMPAADYIIKENIYGCANTQCNNHTGMNSSHKFCPVCGQPGKNYEKQKKVIQTVHWSDFASDCGLNYDEFYQVNDTKYLIGNTKSYGSNIGAFSDADNVEYKPSEITKLIKKFKSENNGMLIMFKENYGIEMEIVFGAFIYYS